jgi:hypothetical protein
MKKNKTLKIGRSEFDLLMKGNHYFVDKSMFIYAFYHNANDILLIPRPKRFGKTLNLSMIEHYFDIQKPESATFFAELKIAKHPEFNAEHQNKYPVINISLKDIKATNWEKCYDKFKMEISGLYRKHLYLLNSDKLYDIDKKNFELVLNGEAPQAQFEYSLQYLSDYLYKHFENKVIILVDEYDTPIITAFKYTPPPIKTFQTENLTYYENVISFMQTFLGKAYKGNDYLKKGLLTGVMRVGKESIFSEWNNFFVYGITSHYFSDSFGFTLDETQEMLNYFDLEHQADNVQHWYNGYKFGDCDNIYNPWSIVNYIANQKDGFKPYWVNSGDYSLIKNRITELNVKETIQELIEGKTIDKELKENFVFQDFETNHELLWTLLTDNGYLTQVQESDFGNYQLRIPNNEVKIVFTDIIKAWIQEEVKLTRDLLVNTARSLINNRLTEFEIGFKQIIGDTISYFDTAERSVTQEQIYHVYTLGLLAILADDFMIKSNRESGEGRYDIMLIPYNKNSNGIIIEIKSIEKQQENEEKQAFTQRINQEIDLALQQIEKKEYFKELLANKITPGKIIRLAIIFAGKVPYITRLAES